MNLGGMPFQIDDEAYEKLNAYLSAVKRKFSHVQGSEEIVEDIEARMAEMFQDNLDATSGKIVSIKAVDGAIEAMGRPEEFEQGFEDDDYTSERIAEDSKPYSVGKKLYRDPNDKVLGGVISGLSQYFGLESPTFIRIIWAALPVLDIFMGGISTSLVLLTYVVLWIAVPKALTATQKMQMRGEPVNLDNIHRSFTGEEVKKKDRPEGRSREVGRGFVEILRAIIKGFGKLLLVFGLSIASIVVIVLILALIFGALGSGIAIPSITTSVLGNNWMSWFIAIGIILMLIALPIFLICLFSKLLFKTKTNMPAIAFGTLGAFLLGFIFTTVSGFSLSKEFSNSSIIRETTTLQPSSDLYLHLPDMFTQLNQDDDFFFGIESPFTLNENVDLKVVSTNDSLPSIVIKKKATGRTPEAAKIIADNIEYAIDVKDNSLTFPRVLDYSNKDPWRNQSVDAILKIPQNTIVHFDGNLFSLLDEVKINGKDYRPGVVVGKTWKYMDNEFVPIDDDGNPIENVDYDDSNGDVRFKWDEDKSIIDIDEGSENVDIRLFGKEMFKLNVTEKNEEGGAKRVSIKVGGKEAIKIEVDEDGEVIEVH